MRSQRIGDGSERTFALDLDTGDAAMKTLTVREQLAAEAHVRPTLEVVLREAPAHLRERIDPVSGPLLILPDER